MKGNKGITLIALIVTIIVLIILAGVAIAMLSGDSGILNRASEARYDTILASVDEQVKLAAVNVKTSITAQMVSKPGYIATRNTKTATEEADPNYFTALVTEVTNDLDASDSKAATGFTVKGYLTDSTSDDANGGDGIGYILITYSENALRASLPVNSTFVYPLSFNGITYTTVPATTVSSNTVTAGVSPNVAVVTYVIKVTNYGCTLSKPIITNTTTVSSAKAGTVETALDFRTETYNASGVLTSTSGTDLGKAFLF